MEHMEVEMMNEADISIHDHDPKPRKVFKPIVPPLDLTDK